MQNIVTVLTLIVAILLISSCYTENQSEEQIAQWSRGDDLSERNLSREVNFAKSTGMFYIPSRKAIRYDYRSSARDKYVSHMVSLYDLDLDSPRVVTDTISGEKITTVMLGVRQLASADYITPVLRENRSSLPLNPHYGLGQNYFIYQPFKGDDSESIIALLKTLRDE